MIAKHDSVRSRFVTMLRALSSASASPAKSKMMPKFVRWLQRQTVEVAVLSSATVHWPSEELPVDQLLVSGLHQAHARSSNAF